MTTTTHFKMTGFKELDAVLKELADVNSNAVRAVLRESLQVAAKPIVPLARSKIRKGPTGNLRKSIGARSTGERRGPVTIAIGPRVGKGFKGYHGHLVEFGHKLVRAGVTYGHVAARPFMRPAWDAEGGDKALARLAKELGPRIIKHADRIAKKHGVKKRR